MLTPNRPLLNRREFSTRCAAFGLSLPAIGTAAAQSAGATVRFPDGTSVPALGQGAWHLGQGRHPPAVEEEAVRTGISLGMTLIDTSGNYGDGRSEQFIGHVIAGSARPHIPGLQGGGRRSVWRWHRACLRGEPRSSRHRPSRSLFAAFAGAQHGNSPAWSRHSNNCARRGRFAPGAYRISTWARWKSCSVCRTAIAAPPIRLLTVSRNRRIERDVLPWCAQHNMPVMAYSPARRRRQSRGG